MSFLGPLEPNVPTKVDLSVDGGTVISAVVNAPDTSKFAVVQQATMQPATDARTAQRSLSLTTDPVIEFKPEFADHTVGLVSRAIQAETAPGAGAYADLVPTATSPAGVLQRYRYTVQTYDGAGVAVDDPVNLFSQAKAVTAHVPPGNLAADAIVFDPPYSSQSGTEASATWVNGTTAGSSNIVGIQYRLLPSGVWSGTAAVQPGSKFGLVLGASAAGQQVEVRAVDADGQVSVTPVTQTSTGETLSGGPSLSIELNFNSGVYPAGVNCVAVPSGFDVPVERSFELIEVYWDMDDDGHFDIEMGTPQYPRFPHHQKWIVDGVEVVVRGPCVYNIATGALIETQTIAPAVPTGTVKEYLGIYKGFRVGQHCGHPYLDGGTKTIRAWANTRARIEAGLPWVPAQTTYTAQTLQQGCPRVVCVGQVTGEEPAYMTARYDTFDQCITAEREKSTPIAILFARGQFHDVTTAQTWGGTKPSISRIGDYGTGYKPWVSDTPKQPAGSGDGTDIADFNYRRFHIYDPRLPFGSFAKGSNQIKIETNQTGRHVLYGMDLRGGNQNILVFNYSKNVVVANCHASHHFDYDLYCGKEVGTAAFIANRFEQPIGTYTGDWGESDKNPNSPQIPYVADHGSFRGNQFKPNMSIFASLHIPRNSWGARGPQPPVRMEGFGTGEVSRQSNNILMHNTFLGGPGAAPQTFAGVLYAKRFVIEGNIILAPSLEEGNVIKVGASGVVVRNNLIILPNMKQLDPVNGFITYNGTGAAGIDPDMALYGISIYGNTFVDQRDPAVSIVSVDNLSGIATAPIAYFEEVNNIYEIAGGATFDTGDGPFDQTVMTQIEFNYHMLNMGWDNFDIPADSIRSYHPAAGAAGAAVGQVGCFDGWGNIRPAATVRGWSHA